MDDMIDALFHGNLDLSLLDLKKDSQYYKTRNEILNILESLESPETKKKTDHLSDALNDLDYVISHAYFTIGFRWGARMMLSMLNDDHGTFDPVI